MSPVRVRFRRWIAVIIIYALQYDVNAIVACIFNRLRFRRLRRHKEQIV